MTAFLQVQGLHKTFRTGRGLFGGKSYFTAVRDVSLEIDKGKTLGLIGESGSGKSTTARMICRLVTPDAGSVRLEGREMLTARSNETRAFAREVQIVFQDPSASLNPRWKVGRLIAEGLRIHRIGDEASRLSRVANLLELCGLAPQAADRYPHEFSGGQRQRIAIARALAVNPKLLVLDEPVSALDVSVQAQILALLKELQTQLNLTYLLIAHDLAVVEIFCDQVAVMHRGEIVERGKSGDLYLHPSNPYTKALIDAHPVADPRVRRIRRGPERGTGHE